jgi:hypothetical protein
VSEARGEGRGRVLDAEKSLLELQRLVRRSPDSPSGQSAPLIMRLPEDLASDDAKTVCFLRDEVDAADQAVAALLADLRFEGLDRAKDKVHRFMAESWVDRSTDHVPLFVASHSREVRHATCYIPVEFLSVTSAMELPGARLLPVDEPQIPPPSPWFILAKPTGCVATVEVEGSSFARMADRARDRVNHLLRAVRIAQSAHVHDDQLRFRIGIGHAFDERLQGWDQRDDEPYELTLTEQDVSELLSHPAMSVPISGRSDIEEKAALAMRWMERACLTGDNLIAMLYRFFALEAVLGDKSEGLKAHGLAFREMMLSHIIDGGFRHPNATFFYYDQIRSVAVHGGQAPDVPRGIAAQFEWAVRDALGNYLALARQQGFSRRGKLLRFLDQHPDKPKLLAWIRDHGGPGWNEFLERNETPAGSADDAPLEGDHGESP